MHKKLITACLALVAFAAMAVVPAMASASPVLTEGGVAVAAGKKIEAVNVGSIVFANEANSAEKVECNESKLTGEVKTNSGKLIEGNITSSSFKSSGGNCTSTFFGSPTFGVDSPQSMCLASSVLGSGTIKNGACPGSGSLSFTLTNGGLGNCTYTAASVAFTYNTNSSPLHITATKQKFLASGCNFLYPTEGTLTGTWKVTTDGGGELSVS